MVYLYLDTKGVQAFLTYVCLGESFLCLFATIFTITTRDATETTCFKPLSISTGITSEEDTKGK